MKLQPTTLHYFVYRPTLAVLGGVLIFKSSNILPLLWGGLWALAEKRAWCHNWLGWLLNTKFFAVYFTKRSALVSKNSINNRMATLSETMNPGKLSTEILHNNWKVFIKTLLNVCKSASTKILNKINSLAHKPARCGVTIIRIVEILHWQV